LASVAPILKLAEIKGVRMPIVEQVLAVIEGRMDPRDIAPTLTHETDEPASE
jgi:glycerol-3-phosphate dehydrogenase (NAD(P)+)